MGAFGRQVVEALPCTPMGNPCLAAALLLAALAPAQRTWIVNKSGGAGVDFTDIPPAIAAAAPGDTVRALGTSSTTYTPFTLTKALTVETNAGAQLYSPLVPLLRVAQIPAGRVA